MLANYGKNRHFLSLKVHALFGVPIFSLPFRRHFLQHSSNLLNEKAHASTHLLHAFEYLAFYLFSSCYLSLSSILGMPGTLQRAIHKSPLKSTHLSSSSSIEIITRFESLPSVGRHAGKRKAVVANPRACTLCRECIRGEGWEERVAVRRVKDHFICKSSTQPHSAHYLY